MFVVRYCSPRISKISMPNTAIPCRVLTLIASNTSGAVKVNSASESAPFASSLIATIFSKLSFHASKWTRRKRGSSLYNPIFIFDTWPLRLLRNRFHGNGWRIAVCEQGLFRRTIFSILVHCTNMHKEGFPLMMREDLSGFISLIHFKSGITAGGRDCFPSELTASP